MAGKAAGRKTSLKRRGEEGRRGFLLLLLPEVAVGEKPLLQGKDVMGKTSPKKGHPGRKNMDVVRKKAWTSWCGSSA